MRNFEMEVNTKENGKYKVVGSVVVHYPTLEDMGLGVKPSKYVDLDGKDATEQDAAAFPVYADDKHQYVFDGILAAVKAAARNKLQPGSANLKDGVKIAETVEELLASGGNTGEALRILREMLAAFKAWLAASSGKSAAVQQAVYELVSNRKTIALQSQEKKEKLRGYIVRFAESLTEDQATAWENNLVKLNEACDAVDALDDM